MEGMAQSSREKQEAFRARKAMLGLTEVRGIYLPPELHAALKAEALKLLTPEMRAELSAGAREIAAAFKMPEEKK
jgi:hypothetical protein